jgi:type II secretory pathway component PulK
MRLRRGGILLITLGTIAALMAILVAVASTQLVSVQAVTNRIQARRARIIAESGIQYGLALLANQDPNQTLQADDWFTEPGQVGATSYTVGVESFRMQIVDAAGLVNLNSATEAQLSTMPLTQEQIDSLLDWREPGNTPRTDGGKDEYYNQLATPYNAKLQALNSLEELLLIKGFTPRSLYEPQTDVVTTAQQLPEKTDGTLPTLYDLSTVDSTSSMVGATGQAKPNINSVQNVQQLIQQLGNPGLAMQIFNRRGQLTTYNALLGVPGMSTQSARLLVSTYSVSNATTVTGKINLNTANDAVLSTIPGMQPDIATAIINQQATGFTDLSNLFDIAGYTIDIARQTLDSFSVNSQSFLIRVLASAGSRHLSVEALVSISAAGPKVLKVTELPIADMSTRWSWDAQPTGTSVLKEVAR